MKTAGDASPGHPGVQLLGAARWPDIWGPIRRFPDRLKERQFWQVQLLVLAATLPHYVIEASGHTEPSETVHSLAISLYIIPLLYAALNFGWEGAILTALWAAALTSPSMWVWHRSGLHWLAEIGQLAITLPVGILVAWRVDRETTQRRRAERTSASLRLLNEVGESLSHTLDVEQRLPDVVQRLLNGLSLESCWLRLDPESRGGAPPVTVEAATTPAALPPGFVQDLHDRAASKREPILIDDRTVCLPLMGDGGMLGSLGARVSGGDRLTREQLDLLTAVAQEVRVALESARLYRERQESLQSYVRQVTQAQEDERLRIARELHDETAQELVQIVRKLEQFQNAADPSQAGAIQELLSMTRGTIQAVRRYSRDLRPSLLDDLGLLAATEMLVEDASRHLQDGARLDLIGTPRRLDAPVELALFRIAQEALRNVEKHGNATCATVEMDFGAEQVRLSVTDDGIGFAPAENISDLVRAGKLGLVGMKERAELVGGSFELRSVPGGGTKVVVTVRPGGRSSGDGAGSTDRAGDDFVRS
jgi:signal transduction histidine kinase